MLACQRSRGSGSAKSLPHDQTPEAEIVPLVQKLTLCCRLQKTAPDGSPTQSAHPARFSPDDKFSRERVECKRRFKLLPTQGPPLEL